MRSVLGVREKKKPSPKYRRDWCPGSESQVAVKVRKYVRCSSCGQRFLASENPWCGSDDPDPYEKKSRRGNTCHPSPFRVPRHKALIKGYA